MNERIVVFLMLLLGSGQTLLTRRSEKEIGIDLSRNYLSSKLSLMPHKDSRAYVCLEVSDSLTPCNFNRVDYSMEEDSSFGNRNKRIKREVKNTDFVIVYKVEGCIPSRLPFRLPLCKHEEYGRSTTEVRRLYPFQTPAGSQSAPSIFPELDHSQWLRLMESIGYRSESLDENKRNMVFKLEGVREEQTWPNRGRGSIESIKRKVSKIPKKYISNKILLQKEWPPTENKKPFEAKKQRFEFRPFMHEEIEKTLYKAQKTIEEDAQQVRNLGQEMVQLEAEMEFPYSRAIPYDPEKLIVAQEGSEFPYSKAIPFDAKKLQVARERSFFPYWKEIPYRSESFEDQSNLNDYTYLNQISFQNHLSYPERSYHSRKLQSMKNDQAVSFDSSMLDAAKQGGVFPYSKEVPRDTSKNILKSNESQERENNERDIKTRVPLRDVNKDTTIKSHISRRSAKSSKTYKSSVNHRFRNLKSIKEGSEFPYSKAIPYDPKKLKSLIFRAKTEDPNLTHRQMRKLKVIKEGSEFPYIKAIPFDPAKLVSSKRKNESTKTKEEYHFRMSPSINAENTLTFTVFLPHNNGASEHNSNLQNRKSSLNTANALGESKESKGISLHSSK